MELKEANLHRRLYNKRNIYIYKHPCEVAYVKERVNTFLNCEIGILRLNERDSQFNDTIAHKQPYAYIYTLDLISYELMRFNTNKKKIVDFIVFVIK